MLGCKHSKEHFQEGLFLAQACAETALDACYEMQKKLGDDWGGILQVSFWLAKWLHKLINKQKQDISMEVTFVTLIHRGVTLGAVKPSSRWSFLPLLSDLRIDGETDSLQAMDHRFDVYPISL